MPLDEKLLSDAKAGLVAVGTAEHLLFAARTSSRDAIRDLHQAGGSLREIATALSLSHQRVHQLVKETNDAAAGNPLTCSFCGATQDEREKLVAGNNQIAICERCADAASSLLDGWAITPSKNRRIEPSLRVVTVKQACSFCSKKAPGDVPVIVVGLSRVSICDECLALCHEIYAEELSAI